MSAGDAVFRPKLAPSGQFMRVCVFACCMRLWASAHVHCCANAHVSLRNAGLRAKDGVADMTHLSDIDVNGINENLRVRFKRDEIYTYAGTILVAVNPYKFLKIYENVRVLHRRVGTCALARN